MPDSKPRGWITIGGANVGCISLSAHRTKTRSSDTFEAKLRLGSNGGLSYWGNVKSIDNVAVVFAKVSGGTTLITGDVKSIKLDLLNQTVELSGKCHSDKLNKAKTTEQLLNKQTQDAITLFADRHGLSLNLMGGSSNFVGNTYQIDYNDLTDGETEWDAIHRYLDMEGMSAWVSNNTLNVIPYGFTQGAIAIQYFAPQTTVSGTAMKIELNRNSDIAKGVTTNVSSWHSKQAKVNKATKTYGGGGTPQIYNYHHPDLTQAQATKLAKSRHKANTSHEFSGSIERPGDETVLVSNGLTLSGTGTQFDQTYEITSIADTISQDGYQQTIEFKSLGQD